MDLRFKLYLLPQEAPGPDAEVRGRGGDGVGGGQQAGERLHRGCHDQGPPPELLSRDNFRQSYLITQLVPSSKV